MENIVVKITDNNPDLPAVIKVDGKTYYVNR